MRHTITITLLLLIQWISADAQSIQTKSTLAVEPTDSKETIIKKATHVVPTANQYQALANEFIAFIHFGPNTFSRKEWGNGMEDPSIFQLKELDTDQWCKAMKSAGMEMVVFTAKHHDGFCLWQTRYTKHGIMSTPFRNGKGDVMKDLSKSCQKYGLKLGVYLSPADLYHIENPEGLYGNLSSYTDRVIPRQVEGRPFENKTTFTFKVDDYNEYMLNQLFEVLTEYGPIHEVWFDGAHPKRKGGQTYNYSAWKELIHTLAPKAVIFGRQDLRWCGNEAGGTRTSEWNVLPYQADPNKMNRFDDITGENIAQREQLYGAKYLHYQPAEVNTSIREGWFYRDDTDQKVRNADDVFDMYERSVGGNSIFLLNIPPNREGRFSDEDVQVLKETGKRIKETYSDNLFHSVKGEKKVVDNNPDSYKLITKKGGSIEITTPKEITTNRIVLSEAIQTHSERVEKFAVDAWIDNQWTEIATSTNIGYKRIVRFAEISSNKFRFRFLEFRNQPAISEISAYYYKSRPSQLSIERSLDGLVTIEPIAHTFRWKAHGENSTENLNSGRIIRYTTDGREPNSRSKEYTKPFFIKNGEIKACVFLNKEKGSVAERLFGVVKKNCAVVNASSEQKEKFASAVIDGDKASYWQSKSNKNDSHSIAIDLGKVQSLEGFIYTPQTVNSEGMIQKGEVMVSDNGIDWIRHEEFFFGNLINDPTSRKHYFKKATNTRFIKIRTIEIANNGTTASIAELDFLPAGM